MNNNTTILPHVMQVAAKTIGFNIVPVQPMDPPMGMGTLQHPEYEDDEGDLLRVHIKTDLGFLGICNTILYSHDEERVAFAYNELFSTYRAYLKRGASWISVSCLEEVIYKILNDSITTDAFEMHGEKFSPFTKLIALVRETPKNFVDFFPFVTFNAFGEKEVKEKKYRYIDLRKMILYYIREHDADIKDEQLKFFLKKNLNDFKK